MKTAAFVVRRGDDFVRTLVFRDKRTRGPIDMSTITNWKAQWRGVPEDTFVIDFNVDTTWAAEGVVVVSLTSSQTAMIGRKGVWDIEGVDEAGRRTTYVGGMVLREDDVTYD